jgi:hypothetical protein
MPVRPRAGPRVVPEASYAGLISLAHPVVTTGVPCEGTIRFLPCVAHKIPYVLMAPVSSPAVRAPNAAGPVAMPVRSVPLGGVLRPVTTPRVSVARPRPCAALRVRRV